MNVYIAFLVLLFLSAGIAPLIMKRPSVLLLICLFLTVSLYSTRIFG